MINRGQVKLLYERTLAELKLDSFQLPSGSHSKVYVQCKTCRDEFLREFRYLNHFHNCPQHKTIDGQAHKLCFQCGKYRPLTKFNPNTARFDGVDSICGLCDVAELTQKLQPILERLILVSKNLSIKSELVLEDLKEIFDRQDGRCFYTRVRLIFNDRESPQLAFLDRLDEDQPYTRANTIFVSALAYDRQSNPKFEFIYDLISGMRQNTRLELKTTSPDAQLPFRKRSTDAGWDLTAVEDAEIPAKGVANIDTGLIICPPEHSYYTIEGRSSLWTQGIQPFRGIIDATYQGHLKVALMNVSDKPYAVKKGDRIAQLVLQTALHPDTISIEEFSPVFDGRSANGFGSTGR